jgi:hypothetical protein
MENAKREVDLLGMLEENGRETWLGAPHFRA